MPLEICYFTGGQRERVLRAILLAGHRVLRVYVNDPRRWPKTCATVQLANELDIPVTIIERKSDIETGRWQDASKRIAVGLDPFNR